MTLWNLQNELDWAATSKASNMSTSAINFRYLVHEVAKSVLEFTRLTSVMQESESATATYPQFPAARLR